MLHAFANMTVFSADARAALDRVCAAVRDGLAEAPRRPVSAGEQDSIAATS